MKLETVQSVIALALAAQLGVGPALGAAPVIGTAAAAGSFRLDRATVSGNATLMEGSLLQTLATPSTLDLKSGARVELGALSSGQVFGDRLLLEKGEGRIASGTAYHFEASGLRIYPATASSTGRVSLGAGNRVLVAASTGSFRVMSSVGVLVANVAAGLPLEFEPQATPTAARVTGILQNRGGHLLLTDETTHVTVELVGNGLAKEVGNRVDIAGTTDTSMKPAPEASQVIRATRVTHLAANAQSTAAAPAATGGAPNTDKSGKNRKPAAVPPGSGGAGTAPAGTATAGGSAAGIGIGTVAIIGGVAAAATLGGLAASNNLPGQGGGSTSSSISR